MTRPGPSGDSATNIQDVTENTPLLTSDADHSESSGLHLTGENSQRDDLYTDYLQEFKVITIYTLPILGYFINEIEVWQSLTHDIAVHNS